MKTTKDDHPEGIGTVVLTDAMPEETLLVPADAVMDATYTDDQVRLFCVRGFVQRFPKGTPVSLLVDNPVRVYDAEGHQLGFARVHFGFDTDEDSLMATGYLRYDCPERLDIEAGVGLYWHPLCSHEYRRSLERKDCRSICCKDPCTSACVHNLKHEVRVVVAVTSLVLCNDPRRDAGNIPPVEPQEEV